MITKVRRTLIMIKAREIEIIQVSNQPSSKNYRNKNSCKLNNKKRISKIKSRNKLKITQQSSATPTQFPIIWHGNPKFENLPLYLFVLEKSICMEDQAPSCSKTWQNCLLIFGNGSKYLRKSIQDSLQRAGMVTLQLFLNKKLSILEANASTIHT